MMLLPMLAQQTQATSLTDFIDDDTWVFEQKLDGHRLFLVSAGDDFPITILTRNGTPYTKKVPDAVKNFRFPEGIEPGQMILDGELVDGTFYAFDMPRSGTMADGGPLSTRRVVLETFLNTYPNPFKLVPQAKTRAEKIRLADHALKNNFEGLVLKRAESAYGWGSRGLNWLKLKFFTAAEVVVMEVRDDGKDSVKLGLFKDGVLTEVGRSSLIGKEKDALISKNDVIEVKYLYVGANDRLYQPTIMRKRDDKSPEECTTGQLKWVNKAVLEVL